MMDEKNSSSLVDSTRDYKLIWKNDMNKQFKMIENIVMPITNTQRKGITKSARQVERLEKIIDTIRKTSKERPIWLKKNRINFPQKLEKKSLMEKDGVENYCELGNIKELLELMMNLKLETELGQLLKICP